MKITGLKTFLVNPGTAVNYGTGFSKNWIFVKVYTDAGIEGVGEAFSTGQDLATATVVEDFSRWLVGKDPTRVNYHWQALFRSARYPMGTSAMAALSAVEQALWDITGKSLGVPVYKLLGGACRDRIRVYAGALTVPSYSNAAEGARAAVAAGFTALKTWITQEDAEQTVSGQVAAATRQLTFIRDAVGDAIDLCIDYHGRGFSPAEALPLVRAMEPFNLLFLEEPTLWDNVASMVEIKAKTNVPLAAGEKIINRSMWRELIERRAVDIIQPDPLVCGGILETIKLAAMAEPYHILLAPHHASSPVGIATAANIAACVPNFAILEYGVPLDSPLARAVVPEPLLVKDGYLQLPERPGLGVEFNEEAAREYPFRPYDRPVVINADGSIGLE